MTIGVCIIIVRVSVWLCVIKKVISAPLFKFRSAKVNGITKKLKKKKQVANPLHAYSERWNLRNAKKQLRHDQKVKCTVAEYDSGNGDIFFTF